MEYAQAGLRVLPTRKDSPKQPAEGISGGFKDATTSESIIRDWWSFYDEPAVGIVIPEGILILDVDGAEGMESLKQHDLVVPATMTARTGRGGYHFWYRLPPDIVTTTKRKINHVPKVDLLVNGFVAAPPSMGVSSRYRWQGEFNMDEIADAPEWVVSSYEFDSQHREKLDADKVLDGVKEGSRNTTLFRYGCKLRNTGLTEKEAQVLLESAAANCEPPMSKVEIKGMAKRIWKTYDQNEEEASDLVTFSLAELSTMNLPNPKYLVYEVVGGKKVGVLSSGVWVLTSPPKAGKSALIANVCGAIAEGDMIWGFETERCGILHLDLEQDLIMGKERWEKILGTMPANIHMGTDCKPMDKGGLEQISKFVSAHSDIGMVIIDTLADFWPTEESGHSNAYHREQHVMKQIKKLAKDLGVVVVLIHHDRKNEGGGMMQKASGTYAIVGKADVVMTLERDDDSSYGVLKIKGKNVPQRTIPLTYDMENLTWELS